MAPSDARLVVRVGLILALGGPCIWRCEGLVVPRYQPIG